MKRKTNHFVLVTFFIVCISLVCFQQFSIQSVQVPHHEYSPSVVTIPETKQKSNDRLHLIELLFSTSPSLIGWEESLVDNRRIASGSHVDAQWLKEKEDAEYYFVIEDAPSLGHLTTDLALLWSLLSYGIVKIKYVVFLHVDSRRVYDGSRLGKIFTDYLLPLTEITVKSASILRNTPVASILCADEWEAKVGAKFGPTISRRHITSSHPYQVPWFGGLDGSGLRDVVYEHFNISQIYRPLPTLTYIHRTHKRVITNDKEFQEFLTKWASSNGFHYNPVFLGTDSGGKETLESQVKLFSSTGILVAAHGAACFNSMFMPRNAIVIELMPTSLRWNLFRSLSHSVGVHHIQHFAVAPICSGGEANQCDITIDFDSFSESLSLAHDRWTSATIGDRFFEFPKRGSFGSC
jgi:Glycosyltransferase 61